MWVVALMSPTCKSCQVLEEDFKKMSESQMIKNRTIKLGVVDVSNKANHSIIKEQVGDVNVMFTPTVIMFGEDKHHPVEY